MQPHLVTVQLNPELEDQLLAWVEGEDDENADALRVQRAMRKGYRSGLKWYFALDGSRAAVRKVAEGVLAEHAAVERVLPITEMTSSHGLDGEDEED